MGKLNIVCSSNITLSHSGNYDIISLIALTNHSCAKTYDWLHSVVCNLAITPPHLTSQSPVTGSRSTNTIETTSTTPAHRQDGVSRCFLFISVSKFCQLILFDLLRNTYTVQSRLTNLQWNIWTTCSATARCIFIIITILISQTKVKNTHTHSYELETYTLKTNYATNFRMSCCIMWY